MAKPVTKASEFAVEKTRRRNSESGIRGSAARRSTPTKAAVRATPSSAVSTLGIDAQGHDTPPRLAKRINEVVPPARSSVPA